MDVTQNGRNFKICTNMYKRLNSVVHPFNIRFAQRPDFTGSPPWHARCFVVPRSNTSSRGYE